MLPIPPEITITTTPAVAVAGQRLVVKVHFRCDHAIEYRSIGVRALCRERRPHALFSDVERMADTVENHYDAEDFLWKSPLPEGDSAAEFVFQLPSTLPATFDDGHTTIDLRITVHVDIPWWPDTVVTHSVRVGARTPKKLPRLAPFFATAVGAQEPVIELAYSSEYLHTGAPFECGIAWPAFRESSVASVALDLVAVNEDRYSGKIHETVAQTFRAARVGSTTFARVRDKLDENLTGDFETTHTRLRHEFEARVQRTDGVVHTLRAPCVVLNERSDHAPSARPLAIGPDRNQNLQSIIEQQLAALVDHDGKDSPDAATDALGPLFAMGITFDPARPSVRWQQSATRVEVRPDVHRTLGAATRITLEYASLGLGLSIRRKTLGDSGQVIVGLSDRFAREYAINVRTALQVNLFLATKLSEIACHFSGECEMNDERLTVWFAQRDPERPEIDRAIEPAYSLVEQVLSARREIRAPGALEAHRDAWKSFAAKVEARFCVGEMSIRGWFIHGVELSLVHTFIEGEPADVELRAKTPRPCTDDDARTIAQRAGHATLVVQRDELATTVGLTADPSRIEPLASKLAIAIAKHFDAVSGAYR